MIILYKLMHKNNRLIKFYSYSWLITTISIISIVLYLLTPYSHLCFVLSAIFLYRTIGISGHLFSEYLHFFNENPFTYFNHINIINYIFQGYPYDNVLGKVVSDGTSNMNALFIIMDGISACGWIGILIISFFFIIVKGILNSITLKYDKSLCILIFLPAISSILNVSLSTAVLTCGLLVLYLLFRFSNIAALK